ncbi:hypothetical protein FBY35_0117 [Streptomyces sp. SLBN-118]|uniref:hypothetical protein n=1 Tax=Streptomyces sp. SLBN-118 TaxID=2768454 RepID=UPI00114F21B8|nr:hypothetical protein [Streptomyces sp. SLBN-118]TQK49843.1 hypothetical protein FBY35_0117 [Streptomyces sp. SLBN-118]
MTDANREPVQRHTCSSLSQQLARAAQWVPAAVVLLTAAAILALIVTGHTEPIQAIAVFGTATALGEAAVTVTVNIIRR